jgi:hypothetical protein
VSQRRYDHLSLLRMLTATFGVDPLGDADAEGVQPFGRDVFPKHARDTL